MTLVLLTLVLAVQVSLVVLRATHARRVKTIHITARLHPETPEAELNAHAKSVMVLRYDVDAIDDQALGWMMPASVCDQLQNESQGGAHER